jgi:hypothetical protein
MEDEYPRDELYKKVLFGVTVIVMISYFIVEYDVYRPTKPSEVL